MSAVQKALEGLVASVPTTNRWKLDQEIDFENRDVRRQTIPQHLGKIADDMINWQSTVADELKLTNADRADIAARNQTTPALQRREALSIWKSRLGHQATYKALMEVFVRANKIAYARTIVDILKEGADEPPPTSASPIAAVRASDGAQGTAAIPQSVAAQISKTSTAATGGGSGLVFSPTMNKDQLAQWLLNDPECGEDYKDEIEQLRKSKINGKLFLLLPKDKKLLESLNLNYVFEVLILDKVKGLKESANSSATLASSNEAVLPGSPSSKPILLCGTADLDVPTVTTDSAPLESDERAAWVLKNAVWPQGTAVLQVKFLNDIPTRWTYKKGGLNLGNIEQWAKIWSDRGGGIIPQFQFVGDNSPSDIRVMFVDGDEPSRTIVGKRAQDHRPPVPTMWLNLSSGGDDYKEHVVIHEFGHALGLGHEHQRSEFWKRIKSYIDVNAIKSEFGKASFKINWGKDSEYSKKNASPDYDPNSIMHYPFKKEWLKPEFSDKAKVEEALNEGYIGRKVADVLLAIIERADKPFVTEPSIEDIDLLKQLYSYGISKGSTCTIQAPPTGARIMADSPDTATNQRDATALSPDDHERFYNQLKDHAAKWREIGTHLGFRQPKLDKIQEKPALFMGAPDSWLSELLKQWLQWAPGDERNITECATLEKLKSAVSRAGLGVTAAGLK